VNALTGAIHLGKLGDDSSLGCGRAKGAHHVRLSMAEAMRSPSAEAWNGEPRWRCGTCFGSSGDMPDQLTDVHGGSELALALGDETMLVDVLDSFG
jgi:hypothetical protein